MSEAKNDTNQINQDDNQQQGEEIPLEKLDSKLIFDKDLTLTDKEIVFRFKVFKIMNKKTLNTIELEMHKYDDIFFLMKCKVDFKKFQKIAKENSLTIDFEQLLDAIISMFENNINHNNATKVDFKASEKGGTLSFFDVLELRAVKIFSLDFTNASKNHQFIYAQRKFNEIKELLELKNRELEIFLHEVHKKNYTMFDHISQKAIYVPTEESPGFTDSYKSSGIPGSPKSPKSPRSPKLSK
ncbi:hypothetical protein TVAG_225610 [Trichomonas vaginalis G3]|uniref:Spindle assembly abnormal protein 6 N-terminal domain-containing protein n=1 Tax=Trichomonas vaginalis (strain ATCC PRA-98 / G3) TaxID=412133 RepID=A2DNU0_TRIV3|nr:assembly abnormal protein 6-related family [Trichomonas vaginalis G3]EAY17935.1 hypothetical protein TVAG_225610 [Trichomonas vaginalis G3]KAI5527117.1 assembly abnormal protein 6-related family [Trichomonas vaginalis G3]|eukprot:XP_001578921.1 hypothetical protein [Trichomonas vaginalis G3]